jgi:hypothetical protein
MNPVQNKLKARLNRLPVELAPVKEACLRYLRYCSAMEIDDGASLIAHQPWEGPEAYLLVVSVPPLRDRIAVCTSTFLACKMRRARSSVIPWYSLRSSRDTCDSCKLLPQPQKLPPRSCHVRRPRNSPHRSEMTFFYLQ